MVEGTSTSERIPWVLVSHNAHCLATVGCVDCTAWPQKHTSPSLSFLLRFLPLLPAPGSRTPAPRRSFRRLRAPNLSRSSDVADNTAAPEL